MWPFHKHKWKIVNDYTRHAEIDNMRIQGYFFAHYSGPIRTIRYICEKDDWHTKVDFKVG